VIFQHYLGKASGALDSIGMSLLTTNSFGNLNRDCLWKIGDTNSAKHQVSIDLIGGIKGEISMMESLLI